MDGRVATSLHSLLAVNVFGGQAQPCCVNGAPELIVHTGWDCSCFGKDTRTTMEMRFVVGANGMPEITSEYQDVP